VPGVKILHVKVPSARNVGKIVIAEMYDIEIVVRVKKALEGFLFNKISHIYPSVFLIIAHNSVFVNDKKTQLSEYFLHCRYLFAMI
jgi:hypothetical protein